MAGILIAYCTIREYIYKKFGYDCCPGMTRPIPRQQQLQELEDERIAHQIQQELEAAERQQSIEKKREERRSKYMKFLQPYTMVVKKKDIICVGQGLSADELESSRKSVEMLDLQNISFRSVVSIPDGLDSSCRSTISSGIRNRDKLIRLPVKHHDGSHRHVDGNCSVCLLDYEPGERLIWSTRKVCQHAFHEDCILVWLSKGKKRCPMCRNFFVPGSSVDDKKVITHDIGDLAADPYYAEDEEQIVEILATDDQRSDPSNCPLAQS